MILRNALVTVAAGAIMLSSAAGVLAFHHSSGGTNTIGSYNQKTVTVTKATVDNHAFVSNDVVTVAKTGGNTSTVMGGNALSLTKATTGEAEGSTTGGSANGYSTGGGATGGNTSGNANAGSLTGGGSPSSMIGTGDAGASSTVTNVVNTTIVNQ